jgi:hypothetical protein
MVLVATLKHIQRGSTMSKSSTVRRITVNEENSKKGAAFGIDVKEFDLQSVIKMGLEEVMFQAGLIAVQQLIEAEVHKLVGPRYSRTPGKAVHRWGEQKGLLYVGGQKTKSDPQKDNWRSRGSRAADLQTILEALRNEQSIDGEDVSWSLDQRLRWHSR